ncbi:baseplate J/gp47 family protein [Acidobacterium sp. S8]|uniref:baseplate J/gp47 family protein n=1 Tax=Acidobacterium sp. S8 TaxID=1641854 RepID=UPI00131A67A1|nr:baseplate J/gp47 family protein [Acidobacterium sp. S8]
MPFPSPNLDDRTFTQLVEEARQKIMASCPTWTDLSVGDPGMALVDVFAFLTETMIYRLNRVPDKAYVEFLKLLGVNVLPPGAARVRLVFSLRAPIARAIEIPRGTRVTVARADSSGSAPIFVTVDNALIPAGKTEVDATALHCDLVEAELLGKGTGAPGLVVQVARPPIIAPTEDGFDLVVGVKSDDLDLTARSAGRQYGEQFYRTWREVENFTEVGADGYVYVADRMSGTITFAPAVRMRSETGSLEEAARALAAVPPLNEEIRAWYRRGAGPNGNVAANMLTVLKDPIAGVSVTNPEAAVGGRSAETIDNALLRGPQELHSLQRAVTARDFELIAARSGSVSRARAFTKAALWTYAPAGTVEVVLVPYVEEENRNDGVSAAEIRALQTDEAREQIQRALDERRPLGTACIVTWARYKSVKVKARVVSHVEEDCAALKSRVLERLYQMINPVPAGIYPGWRFGQALRISNIYDAALAEPGVSYVDNTQFIVEEVPERDIACLEADFFQPQTWYAGKDDTVYRSLDDGEGWAAAGKFENQTVFAIKAHPELPGVVALSTQSSNDQPGSQIHLSIDCGDTWIEKARGTYLVEDIAWTTRDGAPVLLMATDVGLYELGMQADSSPIQVFVRSGDEAVGYYSVIATKDFRGDISVAIAARNSGGIFLSSQGGKGNTFRNIGMAGEDVRVLAVQKDGALSFLWAGLAAPVVGDPGKGCCAWQLLGADDPADGWQTFNKDWTGGSCVNLAFSGSRIFAGTYDAGVITLEERNDRATWQAPDVGCGLPIASKQHLFQRIDALSSDSQRDVVLAGTKSGIYRTNDDGQSFQLCSSKVFTDKVMLPANWLFCSGEHEIEVVSEDETGAN